MQKGTQQKKRYKIQIKGEHKVNELSIGFESLYSYNLHSLSSIASRGFPAFTFMSHIIIHQQIQLKRKPITNKDRRNLKKEDISYSMSVI